MLWADPRSYVYQYVNQSFSLVRHNRFTRDTEPHEDLMDSLFLALRAIWWLHAHDRWDLLPYFGLDEERDREAFDSVWNPHFGQRGRILPPPADLLHRDRPLRTLLAACPGVLDALPWVLAAYYCRTAHQGALNERPLRHVLDTVPTPPAETAADSTAGATGADGAT